MALNMQVKKHKDGTIKSRGIQWTDATWNPIAGCPHQCRWTMPDGNVAICYAESIAHGIASKVYPDGFDAHYWKPHMLADPLKKKQALKIFTGSMADIFSHAVPSEQIEAILNVARGTPRHTYQLLTKNPLRTRDFDMPDNVWLGASMPPDFMWNKPLSRNQQERMLRRTMDSLSGANARIKWMSFEPLSWDVSDIIADYPNVLQWAVIGAASHGRNFYPPAVSDFLNLQTVLDSQNVAIFYKGNLSSLGDPVSNWREEFPTQELKQYALF